MLPRIPFHWLKVDEMNGVCGCAALAPELAQALVGKTPPAMPYLAHRPHIYRPDPYIHLNAEVRVFCVLINTAVTVRTIHAILSL